MRKFVALAAAAATALPALAVASAPSVAAAQSYRSGYLSNPCGPPQKNARVSGAVIGGALGAIVGNKVAARGVKTEGTVLGAAAGAAIGQEVGRRKGCQVQQGRAYHPGYAPAYGYRTR
jgi:hypothetical protein